MTVEASIIPMKKSDGITDYYVRVKREGRTMEVAMWSDPYLNRAHYHCDMLNWVFAGGSKPDLMAPKYKDPDDDLPNQQC